MQEQTSEHAQLALVGRHRASHDLGRVLRRLVRRRARHVDPKAAQADEYEQEERVQEAASNRYAKKSV